MTFCHLKSLERDKNKTVRLSDSRKDTRVTNVGLIVRFSKKRRKLEGVESYPFNYLLANVNLFHKDSRLLSGDILSVGDPSLLEGSHFSGHPCRNSATAIMIFLLCLDYRSPHLYISHFSSIEICEIPGDTKSEIRYVP